MDFDVGCWSLWTAKVPASYILELAQTEVQVNDKASRAVREFAQVPKGHAEDGCHKIFKKYDFSIPIKIQHVDLGAGRLKRFPWLKFSSWAQYLLDSNRLPQQLCGAANFDAMKPILVEFWNRYRSLHPEHEVFKMESFDAS